jgi:DnaA family protein
LKRTAQLPLAIEPPAAARFDSFVAGASREAVTALEQVAAGRIGTPVYLWGETGVGKTHLLHATCGAAAALGRKPIYLPMAEGVADYDASVLEGHDAIDVVCIDDIGRVGGMAAWEEALLHLYNRRRDRGRALVLADRRAPGAASIGLPDLRSRLGWGLTYRIHSLDDEDKIAVLTARAAHCGLDLPEAVARFLLAHCARDLAHLLGVLDALDRASLAEQRRLTIPFVRAFLGQDPGQDT